MKRSRLALCLAFVPLAGFACGPDFPSDLLSDRAATLANLPEGAFYFEVQHLVAPAQKFPVVERIDAHGAEQKITRDSVEQDWWGTRYPEIFKMRETANATAVYAANAGLPADALHYLAGAAAFAHGDVEGAKTQFAAVTALPAQERAHYGVWAQYMLGRIAYARKQPADAIAAFAAARALVAQGAADPLGIAATSLGDEARVHLDAGEDAAAIALYAQQAALGSYSGRDSLLAVARAIVRDDARMMRDLADPLAQRLIVAYLFSRGDELTDASVESRMEGEAPKVPDQTMRFLAAVEKLGLDHVAGADRLAALAYRSGRYDLAAQLAPKESSGLAWWVRAKLALRAGDANAAAQAYAQAAKAFPAHEQWGTEQMMIYEPVKPACRIAGEQGTLALSRGEYVQAMEHLYNAAPDYWMDAAYVAERVLTLDELKTFVDAHAPHAVSPAQRQDSDDERSYLLPVSAAESLRTLLARRLLRAERYDEALNYFDGELKQKAQVYVDARKAATHGDRVEQAQAWYAAAHSARFDGLELLGYELDPDYGVYSADFDLNWRADADGKTILAREDIKLPAQFIGKDEPARVAASHAQPLKRFHYRYNAVDFAQKAADQLPPRTQAFAAVLCHATNWLIDRDPPAARQVYARYLKQGAYVPWGASFGRECPQPDFPAAAKRLHDERMAHLRHLARRSLPYVAALGALVIVLSAVLAQRRRTRKTAAEKSSIDDNR